MPVLFRTTGTLRGPEFLLRAHGGARALRLPLVCAVLERPDGITLIDTGFSRAQTAWPAEELGRVGAALLGARLRAEDALASQLISLGLEPRSVRHVIATHLSAHHIAGVMDFPDAVVHSTHAEWAARGRALRGARTAIEARLGQRLELHALAGPPALGFPASHDLFGDGTVLLLDARGATAGALAVAVKLADRWLVHAGDAVLATDELDPGARTPLLARALAADAGARASTVAALREARDAHGAVVVPSHDAERLAMLPTTTEQAWRAAWDTKARKGSAPRGPHAEVDAKG